MSSLRLKTTGLVLTIPGCCNVDRDRWYEDRAYFEGPFCEEALPPTTAHSNSSSTEGSSKIVGVLKPMSTSGY